MIAIARPIFSETGEQLVEIAFDPFGARPAHLVGANRRLAQITGIPIERQTPREVPAPVGADIIINIHHLHDNPFVGPVTHRGLMLVLGINHAVRVIGIVKFYDMAADMVRCPGEG